MLNDDVRGAYAARAREYTVALGSVASMARDDRTLISAWAHGIEGPAIDPGCGPGHWTNFLSQLGVDVEGVDLVDAFITDAAHRFPDVPFRVGTLDALPVTDGKLGAILAWYSLIHTPVARIPAGLTEFARCIRPGGTLLLGFFEGDRIEAFDHAVLTAWFWPAPLMQNRLEAAGFDVIETHTRTDPGRRPHAAIVARRKTNAPPHKLTP